MITVPLPVQPLKGLLKLAAKESHRIALCGVCVQSARIVSAPGLGDHPSSGAKNVAHLAHK